MRVTLPIALLLLLVPSAMAVAQNGNFVPGSGSELPNVGDDFEDPDWTYVYNNPKSTEENNDKQNQPLGKSANGRWFEGAKRGQPDVVQRVETPPGGLPGSTGALLLRSLHTGIPNRPSFKMQQEDFILNVQYRTGGPIPISKSPSVTTRVYLPPTEQWERRTGPQFAFRVALETTKKTPGKFFAFNTKEENEVYWPGLFICMDAKEHTKKSADRIYFRIRSNGQGGDMMGPEITTTGWWTLGLAVSSNGAIHYYAKPGVEDLTMEDYITSQYPYNYRAERFRAAFFNVINADNGRDWSTTWIIDDTRVFSGTAPSQLAMARQNSRPTREFGTKNVAQATPTAPPSPSASFDRTNRTARVEQPRQMTDRTTSQQSNELTLSDLELDYFREDTPREQDNP